MCKEDRIVVPDAAIREYNEKYGKYLPKSAKRLELPLVVDEDAMYIAAMQSCPHTRKRHDNPRETSSPRIPHGTKWC